MSHSILVVEDEAKISDLICKYLALEGYAYHQAGTGLAAVASFEKNNPDLIVLDIMLPDMDGMGVCEKIRAVSAVPIIMLTARVDEIDRLMGFAKGADDYICKPFHPRELVARVKAVLRRVSPAGAEKKILTHGPIVLSMDEHNVRVQGEEIQLTQIEFSLLSALMSNANKVFTREELLVASHDKYSESYERTIDFHIKNLRRKINPGNHTHYIKTVYGVGYRLL